MKKPKPGAQAKASEGADVKEIVFSFDTTGSMYPCLTQVKSEWEILKTNSFLDHFINDQKAKNIYHGIKTVKKNLELKVATYIIEYLHFILYIIILVIIIIIIIVVIILRNTDKQQINSKIMSEKERRYLQQKSQKWSLSQNVEIVKPLYHN